ncbi:MAG: hypothetical protein RLZZ426_1091 [Actinomycetota bacterium]
MSPTSQRSGATRGVVYAFSAYALWGLAPLYWPLLKPASALETLAHRMTWSLVFLVAVNSLRHTWPAIRNVFRNSKQMKLLGIASVLITVNWGLYIWAVLNGHVLDASLGYFINPLVNVAFGVMIFREKLRMAQWVAFVIAGIGVLWLTVDAGKLPWIGLVLGITFSAYGMVKKIADVDAVESLSIETILLLPFSGAYLIWLAFTGTIAFGNSGSTQAFWALLAGVVTAVPLLAFGAATVRIPYSTMGIIQYLSPTIQFLIGVFVLHEAMTQGRWVGFTIVWVSLIIFSIDAIRSGRKFAISEE